MVKRIGSSTTKSGRVVPIYEVPCPTCDRVRVIKRQNHAVNHASKPCKFCSNKSNHPQGEHRGFRLSWWNSYKLGASYRNIVWDLHIDNAVDIYESQGGNCALSGIPLVTCGDFKDITASLDRIDNSQGYVRGNVQFVHKDVNMMRGHLPMERFVELCKAVAGSK